MCSDTLNLIWDKLGYFLPLLCGIFIFSIVDSINNFGTSLVCLLGSSIRWKEFTMILFSFELERSVPWICVRISRIISAGAAHNNGHGAAFAGSAITGSSAR
jgi:hypothetical protein